MTPNISLFIFRVASTDLFWPMVLIFLWVFQSITKISRLNIIVLEDFFFKFVEDKVLFCGGTVLDFWWCLPWISKADQIPCLNVSLSAFNGLYRFTSAAMPANLLLARMASEPFFDPHTCTHNYKHWWDSNPDRVFATLCTLTVGAIPVRQEKK